VIDTLARLGVAAMGFGWDVREMHRGPDELLAVVDAEVDGSAPTSWASLLDAATSAASTIFNGPPRLRMPARIERVHVHGAPPATATLLVRRRPGTTTTDVTITDGAGSVLVSIAGMAFEELENPGQLSAGDPTRLLHHVAWREVAWDCDDRPSGVVLVGGDVDGLDSAVRDLTAAGIPYRAVEDPSEIADIAEFDGLPPELGRTAVVVVLPRQDEAPEASVDLVVRTLTRLQESSLTARLWVLTTGVYEGGNLGHSPLWGLARVAAAEHPGLWGGVIDLGGVDSADGRVPLGALTSLHGHGVVVIRDGVALVARLAAPAAGSGDPMQCSPGGTYLITGGTGVLGLLIAQRLADLGARRLVLLSRSGLPPRSQWDGDSDRADTIRAVAALEERGVSVTVAAVDLGAPGSADVLRSVLRDLPPVRGVIHAAGVEAGALLSNTTAEDFAATMHPKVHGTLALHEVFPPEQLDWMVLFSSCGYLAGFPGQGAYACANSFLDVMARHRRSLGDRTTAIAWTAWRGLGMGSTSDFVAAQLDALGMGTLTADDALRALDLAMRDDDPNVVVLPVLPAAATVPMLADVAPADDDPADGAGEGIDAEMGSGEFDPDRLARLVLAAVAGQLGLAEADVDADLPLVELGVDSIMTVRLRRQLEKQTGLSLPPTLLWEHPTAAAVSARIVEMLSPASPVSR
jgi:6-methylsalicylic acid synthase